MEKKKYVKPCTDVRKVYVGTLLLTASSPTYKAALKYNIEGTIEPQKFNDNSFETSWGEISTANNDE